MSEVFIISNLAKFYKVLVTKVHLMLVATKEYECILIQFLVLAVEENI